MTVQRHRQNGNLKVGVSDQPTEHGVDARDAYASKKQQSFHQSYITMYSPLMAVPLTQRDMQA